MKKGGGSESTIIIGSFKSVVVYAFHSLEDVISFARFIILLYYYYIIIILYYILLIGFNTKRDCDYIKENN